MNNPARVLLALLVVAALGFVGWRTWSAQRAAATRSGAAADSSLTGLHPVTLWFADAGGDSLVSETRGLRQAEGLHERTSQLVEALVRGPAGGGVAVVPNGTTVLRAYLDDRGQLTLDLSRAFQQGFHGGSREEDLVIGSLVRTIGSNLPEVKRVLFVCGGAPIASLGGHLPLDRPIDPHDGY